LTKEGFSKHDSLTGRLEGVDNADNDAKLLVQLEQASSCVWTPSAWVNAAAVALPLCHAHLSPIIMIKLQKHESIGAICCTGLPQHKPFVINTSNVVTTALVSSASGQAWARPLGDPDQRQPHECAWKLAHMIQKCLPAPSRDT
jgi:hypothetical protein